MRRTSFHWPPAYGYRRPPGRKFYVWRDRVIHYGPHRTWGAAPWRWCCTMCEPPAFGFRARSGGWHAIMTVTLPGHMRRRHSHHQWAAKRPVPEDTT